MRITLNYIIETINEAKVYTDLISHGQIIKMQTDIIFMLILLSIEIENLIDKVNYDIQGYKNSESGYHQRINEQYLR